MSNIKFLSSGFSTDLASFDQEISRMERLFEEVKNTVSSSSDFWESNSSEAFCTQFNQFAKQFEEINKQNKKYLTFLKNVLNRYSLMENSISQIIDENVKSFSINGSHLGTASSSTGTKGTNNDNTNKNSPYDV